MRVLVTGVTGFIGRNLLEKLLSLKKIKVICYIRNSKYKKELEKKGCKVIMGELTDYAKLVKSLKKVDLLIHLVGIGNVSVDSKEAYEEFKKINVSATENITKAAIKAKVKKMIYTSSIAAMGSECNGVMDETSTPHPRISYEKSKYEAELMLEKLAEKSHLQIFILRPGWVIGKGDKGSDIIKLANMVKKGFVPLINGGKFHTMLVSVDSVTDSIILCFKKKIKGSRVYIILEERSYKQKELIYMIADSLIKENIISKRPAILYLPKPLMFVAATFFEVLSKVAKTLMFISRKRVHSMSQDRHYSIKKAKKELNYSPKGIIPAIESEISWLKGENKI